MNSSRIVSAGIRIVSVIGAIPKSSRFFIYRASFPKHSLRAHDVTPNDWGSGPLSIRRCRVRWPLISFRVCSFTQHQRQNHDITMLPRRSTSSRRVIAQCADSVALIVTRAQGMPAFHAVHSEVGSPCQRRLTCIPVAPHTPRYEPAQGTR